MRGRERAKGEEDGWRKAGNEKREDEGEGSEKGRGEREKGEAREEITRIRSERKGERGR